MPTLHVPDFVLGAKGTTVNQGTVAALRLTVQSESQISKHGIRVGGSPGQYGSVDSEDIPTSGSQGSFSMEVMAVL